MKRCNKCGQERPIEDFHRDKSRKSGRSPWCKPCARKRRNDWYEKNRETNLAYQAEWREANKEKKSEGDRAWREANVDRKRSTDAVWRDANRDKTRAYFRERYRQMPEYYELHRAIRKARKKGVERQPYTRREIYDRDGGRCKLCGFEVPFGSDAHIDHIVPLALKGPDIPANLQLTCSPCNRGKRDLLEGQLYFAT